MGTTTIRPFTGWDETLFFQNGHANWMRHTQRLYHSRETLQMERFDTAEPPQEVENAAVLPLDDGVPFCIRSWKR